jgi:hypothetical protein
MIEALDSPVNTEQMQRLNDFLARNDLQHHLTEAKENLQKIKTFIETNFSVVELMIDEGSDQLKKKALAVHCLAARVWR